VWSIIIPVFVYLGDQSREINGRSHKMRLRDLKIWDLIKLSFVVLIASSLARILISNAKWLLIKNGILADKAESAPPLSDTSVMAPIVTNPDSFILIFEQWGWAFISFTLSVLILKFICRFSRLGKIWIGSESLT